MLNQKKQRIFTLQAAVDYQIDTDRRHFERTKVALFGRCLIAENLEIPCQATDISPGDVAVIAAHSPRINDHIIIYLDHVGRVEGKTQRMFDGGFAMSIDATPRKREKLTARIEWLKSHYSFGLEDAREHARIVPRDTNSVLKLSDHRSYPVEILDISLSGAAVAIDVKPAIGSPVSLAGMNGKVNRHFPEGIALEFSTPSTSSAMSRHFR